MELVLLIGLRVANKKRNLKVHKQRTLVHGAPLSMCGVCGNIANHSSWEKVTCKKCHSLRKHDEK